jgi:hypothetical protein
MNIILFITLIVLILIFAYQQIRYYLNKEHFKLELDVTWVDDKKVTNKKKSNTNKTDRLQYDFNVSNTKYNQLKEFIPDKDNYTIYKDTGIMIDIDKPIKLNSIEFDNLKKRLDFYRKLEHDVRHGEKAMKIKKKMILEQDEEDTSNYPLVRKEITLLKLDRIISVISNKNKFTEEKHQKNTGSNKKVSLIEPHDIKVRLETLESYRFVKNWILEELSNEALKELYVVKFTNSERFKFKQDKIINYYIDYENNLERFEFQGIIYRNNKEHNFFVYFDIVFNNKLINYYVNNIIVLGINIEQLIIFADLLDKNYYLDSNEKHLSMSNENPAYVTDKHINEYAKTVTNFVKDDVERRKQEQRFQLENGYCFFKDSPDKDTCISYTEEGGVGIWDTPCKYNEECPFYKKNMNYPNSRGGCNNGFCEMPVNIKLLGYKEYNESGENAAICYNCENRPGCKGIECSQCCEDQKDISLYPNLSSPDYAFDNDYFERIKNTKYFKKKDMAPINIKIGF